MADRKRFWKESIGVVGKKKKKALSRGDASPEHIVAKSENLEAKPVEAAPAKKAASPSTTTVTTSPQQRTRRRDLPSVERRREAQKAALAPVAELLDSLPLGSMDFPRQVADKLWPDPDPQELRCIGIIASDRRAVRDDRAAQAILRVIVTRQRVGSLLAGRHLVAGDPLRLEARASEWSRLAEVVEECLARLHIPEDSPAQAAVIGAARSLLPSPQKLRHEGALCSALAGLVASVQTFSSAPASRGGAEVPLAMHVVPEAAAVLERLRAGALDPSDMIYLELCAGLLLAHQDLARSDRPALERDRALLAATGAKLESEIDRALAAHHRDPEATEHLAAWRRRSLEMRSRIDERLTAPGQRTPHDPSEEGAFSPSAYDEAALLAHLAKVRPEESGEESDAKRKGWRRWLPMSFGALALASLVAINLMLPEALPPAPRISAADFRGAIALTTADGAGALLIATADPTWSSLDEEQRRVATIRLAANAETKGFQAGILLATDGAPLASWVPGAEPHLRRGPGLRRLAALRSVSERDGVMPRRAYLKR